MILTLNLLTFGSELGRWRLVQDLPQVSSIGQGADGKFNTMILKECPPALCGALAHAFQHALLGQAIDADVQIPCNFFDLCDSMLVKTCSDHIGPDFAGGAS